MRFRLCFYTKACVSGPVFCRFIFNLHFTCELSGAVSAEQPEGCGCAGHGACGGLVAVHGQPACVQAPLRDSLPRPGRCLLGGFGFGICEVAWCRAGGTCVCSQH